MPSTTIRAFEVEAMVLGVDAEANRISLGIKQLDSDPFSEYLVGSDRGAIVTGTVKEVDAKGAVIALADEVDGYLRAKSSVTRLKVNKHLSVGDSVEAKSLTSIANHATLTCLSKLRTKTMSVKPFKSTLKLPLLMLNRKPW